MPTQLIREKDQVNLNEFPSIDSEDRGTSDSQFTIGDLHGNAIKLIYMLIKHRIVSQVEEVDYLRLVEIYYTSDLNSNHLEEFHRILGKMHFSSAATIRLIGDELSDRGKNDYFTLLILEKLHANKVKYEILLSNHAFEFICAYEQNRDFQPVGLVNCASSMVGLDLFIQRRIVNRQEILRTVNTVYKPFLRAISYSLSEDCKEINVFSHAAIGLNTIEWLANMCQSEYKDASSLDLAETIDQINAFFQQAVQNNNVHALSSFIESPEQPFQFIMWNREYDQLTRPIKHHEFRINFIHGHDPNEQTENHIFNLDNDLGKFQASGNYEILYANKQISFMAEVMIERTTDDPSETLKKMEFLFKAFTWLAHQSYEHNHISVLTQLINEGCANQFTSWQHLFDQEKIELWMCEDKPDIKIKKTMILLELHELLWRRTDFVGKIPLHYDMHSPNLLVEAAVRLLCIAARDCLDKENKSAIERAHTRISLIAFLPPKFYTEIFAHPDLTPWKTDLSLGVAEVFGRLFYHLDHQAERGLSGKKLIAAAFIPSAHQSFNAVQEYWTYVHNSRSNINIDIPTFLDQYTNHKIDERLRGFLIILYSISRCEEFQITNEYPLLFNDERFNISKIIESPAVFHMIAKTMCYKTPDTLGASDKASQGTIESYTRYHKTQHEDRKLKQREECLSYVSCLFFKYPDVEITEKTTACSLNYSESNSAMMRAFSE